MPKDFQSMEELLETHGAELKPLAEGDVVTGKVIVVNRNNCWIDIEGYGTGVVYGKELTDPTVDVKDLNPGDEVSALVIEPEDEKGHVILSLRRATREKMWTILSEMMHKGETFEVKPYDANKGGLLIEYEGIRGFLPVSQLALENYPRVAGGDKDEILHRLNALIGKSLSVRVLDVDKRTSKLIFSERAARKEHTENMLSKFKVGDKVAGKVTGVVDFGIFMNIDGVEGLIHISELDWDRVESTTNYAQIGQDLEVQIIAIDDDKISLSLKRLQLDPWLSEIKGYSEEQVISGKISKITPFGAFVKVGNIEALVHVSEMAEEHIKSPDEVVKLDQEYDFRVVSIEPETRKLSLSLKGVDEAREKAEVKPKKPAAKKTVTKKTTAKKPAGSQKSKVKSQKSK